MTILQHISAIRNLIKQYADDSNYENEFLFVLLNNANATWLRRKLDNNEKVNDWNWPSYCIELEAGLSHDCDCVPVGCKVLKSKYKIPKPLLSRNRLMIKVYTIDGKEIENTTEEKIKVSKYDEIKKKQLAYSVNNQKLIIWNGNPELIVPRAVIIKSLSVDPTEWGTVESCNPNSGNPTGDVCFDIDTSEYPMDEEYATLVYDTVLKQLNITLQIPEDKTNNNNAEI